MTISYGIKLVSLWLVPPLPVRDDAVTGRDDSILIRYLCWGIIKIGASMVTGAMINT